MAAGSRFTRAETAERQPYQALGNCDPAWKYCKACAVAVSTKAITEGAKAGRIAALTPEAMQRRGESGKRQNEALQAWKPADQPTWLTSEYYISQVQPRLAQYTRPRIAEALSISSTAYAGKIRNGKIVPHPRHWLKLAELVGAAKSNG